MPSPVPLTTAHASSTLPPKKEHLPTNVLAADSESGWYSKNLTSDADGGKGGEKKRHKVRGGSVRVCVWGGRVGRCPCCGRRVLWDRVHPN